MLEINVKEARDQFRTLLDRVAQGEDILITRRGKPVARLTAPGAVEAILPSLAGFRASIKTIDKALSQTVTDLRHDERY